MAVSLQDQCLFFIVGHLFESDNGDEGIPLVMLARLPLAIRRQLLLLLPVVDVCRLEDTPVTNGIVMDEIWEALFNKRMPIHHKGKLLEEGRDFYTATEWEEKGVTCSWKDAYFINFLGFSDSSSDDMYLSMFDTECDCGFPDHFPADLLYGVCDYYNCIIPTPFYRLFCNTNISNFHGLLYYTECSVFPLRYYHDTLEDQYPQEALIDTLVDICNVQLKHFSTYFYLSSQYQDLRNGIVCETQREKLSRLLSSVESVEFKVNGNEDIIIVKKLLDILPGQSIIRACISLFENDFDFLLSYFVRPLQCHLKYLEVKTKSPKSILAVVIEHHKELECLELSTPFDTLDINCRIVQVITQDLFYRPVFKRLFLAVGVINFEVLLSLFRNFFNSPYPVSLSFQGTKSLHFDPLPDPLPIHCSEKKSLELSGCLFSHDFVSLFSPNLLLKSLQLSTNANDVIICFSNLQSIQVESFSLTHIMDSKTVSLICSLMSIITADQWYLGFEIMDEDNTVPLLLDILSTIKPGHLHRLYLKDSLLSEENILSIVDIVFCSLSPTPAPYFELDVSCIEMSVDFGKSLHNKWRECVASESVKPLKSLRLSDKIKETEMLMKEMSASKPEYFFDFLEEEQQ